MIKFENVMKKYEDGFVALKDINLEIKKGELVTLIGPSGCGKTTTMRMINRLTEPSSGKISIDGQDISKLILLNYEETSDMLSNKLGYFRI